MAIFSRSAKKLTAVSLYLTFVFAFTITMRKIRVAEIDTRLVLRFLSLSSSKVTVLGKFVNVRVKLFL